MSSATENSKRISCYLFVASSIINKKITIRRNIPSLKGNNDVKSLFVKLKSGLWFYRIALSHFHAKERDKR